VVFECDRDDDRLTLRRPGMRWLSNGFDGGYREADAAHNLTVQEGFDRTDLAAYAAERLGDRPTGPTLLTGVGQQHARGARLGTVAAVATAGLSNPAALPVPGGGAGDGADVRAAPHETTGRDGAQGKPGSRPGTVNVFVGTTRALGDAALAGLLATAVEAKAATLLAAAAVPGTSTDAVAVGCDPAGESARFAGSATPVGSAARACVRDAVLASLESRYAAEDGPPSFEDARYGVVTDQRADVFEP
jgi:adenosylcobinamide hydrolase